MELKVREVRMVTGINQAAKRFGCSKGHLSLVIRGFRKPGDELARKLRKAGVSLAEKEAS